MNRVAVAQELVKIAKSLVAIRFDTEEEMKKYKQEHEVRPETKLTVKKTEEKPESKVPDFKSWRRNQKFLQYLHKESGGEKMGISRIKQIWDKWTAEAFNK
jgi:hypothetical protein